MNPQDPRKTLVTVEDVAQWCAEVTGGAFRYGHTSEAGFADGVSTLSWKRTDEIAAKAYYLGAAVAWLDGAPMDVWLAGEYSLSGYKYAARAAWTDGADTALRRKEARGQDTQPSQPSPGERP